MIDQVIATITGGVGILALLCLIRILVNSRRKAKQKTNADKQMTSVPTVVIVDMQDYFRTSAAVIQEVRQEVALAAKNNWPVIVLEYKGCGDTNKEIMNDIRKTDLRWVVAIKSANDGSKEVAQACADNHFETDVFRVCGVNILACVKQTVQGLNSQFPHSWIDVIKEACNGHSGVYDWSDWPSLPKVVVRSQNAPS